MLQIPVYPYLLCSLMYGLGRLTSATARQLLGATWIPFLFLWILTLATLWVLAHAIPPTAPPLSLTASQMRGRIPLLNLLIPSNPFAALRKNYIPAVAIFAVIYGVAFQSADHKQTLLEIFDAVKKASVKIWGWIVRLAPFGVFALLASTAGTVRPDRLGGMVLYVVLYLLGAIILGLFVIPFLISALVWESYVPSCAIFARRLSSPWSRPSRLRRCPWWNARWSPPSTKLGCSDSEERRSVVQTSLSLSYVFGQVGNNFIYLLILYSGYFSDVPLKLAEKARFRS